MNLYTASLPEVLREAADRLDPVVASARSALAPAHTATGAAKTSRLDQTAEAFLERE